jgi:hypothetical protein
MAVGEGNYCYGIRLLEMKKITKTFGQNIWYPGRDPKKRLSKFEARMLTTRS